MASGESSAEKADQDRPTVLFHYIKANAFRVIHVDGVHGGVTPRLQVQMALFSERLPIPQQVLHSVTDQGALMEPPANVVSKTGLVREVEVEALMDLATAKALAAWLEDKIKMLEGLVQGAGKSS